MTTTDLLQSSSGSQTPFTINRDKYLEYKQARLAHERQYGEIDWKTIVLRQRAMELTNNIIYSNKLPMSSQELNDRGRKSREQSIIKMFPVK